MQAKGTYQLTNNGATAGAIYSIHGHWKEHGDAEFAGLMQTMNNNYRLFIDETIFCALFEDPTTKAVLKADALTLVNNWYCGKMLEVSVHVDPLPEATAILTLAKKIPFSYLAQNGNHIVLDTLEDFGYMLNYLDDFNNGYNEMRNFGKWHNVDKKYAVLFKETSFLYPTERRISGLDWTKLTEQFFGFQTFTGLGAPALTNEVVHIANCFKEMSDATKNSCAEFEAAKEVVDTTDTNFPTDVPSIYNNTTIGTSSEIGYYHL